MDRSNMNATTGAAVNGRGHAREPVNSLRDIAYEEIKRRIITLAYQPGAYINEAGICLDLQIGRTPVHMALERLAIEGMVEVIPRKGVIVRPISVDEIRSIVEARLLNEPSAARLAATRATGEELDRLRAIAKQARETPLHDTEVLMQLDRQLHATIAEATRNRVLGQILNTLHERSLRHWFMSLSDARHEERVADEHDDIVAAIASRDPQRAEQAMRDHIDSFSTVINRIV
jgi:DNA-binding GntR family transcriptional regulator